VKRRLLACLKAGEKKKTGVDGRRKQKVGRQGLKVILVKAPREVLTKSEHRGKQKGVALQARTSGTRRENKDDQNNGLGQSANLWQAAPEKKERRKGGKALPYESCCWSGAKL